MDLPPFELSESARTLRTAGVRLLLRSGAGPAGSLLSGNLPALSHSWSPLLAKTPRNALCVWTYFDLGADLGGQANQERSALWRDLVSRLGLPRGSIAFWPYTHLQDGRPMASFGDFLAGLKTLQARSLVVFGEDQFMGSLWEFARQAAQGEQIGLPVTFGPTPDDLLHADLRVRVELAQALADFIGRLD